MFSLTQRFLDPEKVMFRAGLTKGMTVADLGAGSGHYALASAQAVGANGKVYVVDILDTALNQIAAEARVKMLKNLVTVRADLESKDSIPKISSGSGDFVILGNVFHQVANKQNLLAESYRVLKTGGKLLLVDWNDKPSPIGPMHSVRVPESDAKKLISANGFKFENMVDTDQYHYGLVFVK